MNDSSEQPPGGGETVQPTGDDSAAPVEQAPEPAPEAPADGRPPAYPDGWSELDSRAVDTIRVLAMDAVQKTGNGHPGTAMSLAPLAYVLFQQVMRHDPGDDQWLGRDRFVLSCGHCGPGTRRPRDIRSTGTP